jgi:hypothetical protein
MTSVITPRTGAVPGSGPVSGSGGGGIFQCSNVAGTGAYTADVFPSIDEYVANRLYLIRPPFQNVGAATINISGEGIQGWKKPDGSDFASGELSPNLEYLIKDSGLGTFITLTPSF